MDANVLDHEPELALFVDDSDPLLFYRTIAIHGRTILKQGGKLYFEINQKYGNETASMLKQQDYDNIEIIKDIYINDRIVKATYNG